MAHSSESSLSKKKETFMPRTGILDSLTDDQKDQLFSWMQSLPINDVLDKMAAAPPDGFGIKTYVTSLRRFYQREKLFRGRDNLPLARMAHLNSEELAILQNASTATLTHHFFEAISAPGENQNYIAAAAKWPTRPKHILWLSHRIAFSRTA